MSKLCRLIFVKHFSLIFLGFFLAHLYPCFLNLGKKLIVKEINNPLSLQESIEMVRAFHNAFKIENAANPTGSISRTEFELRHRLMQEENDEYLKAAREGDIVEIADALGDMLYILCGTILKHGLQSKIEAVFKEIQRSNMSKLDENGLPVFRADGKVLKGNGYTKPDILSIL